MRLHVFWLTIVALVALPIAPRAVAQQISSCRGPDSTSIELVELVVQYAATTDPVYAATRDSLGLPSVSAGNVTLVTNNSVCKKAALAYGAQLTVNTSTLSGRVYVVKAGDTYTAYDPEYVFQDPEVWIIMTFDRRFNLLSIY